MKNICTNCLFIIAAVALLVLEILIIKVLWSVLFTPIGVAGAIGISAVINTVGLIVLYMSTDLSEMDNDENDENEIY